MTLYYFKRLIKISLLMILFGSNYIYSQEISSLSALERQLVKDAREKINLQINNKKGTFERISCFYKVSNTMPLSTSIETIYVDYRKPAELQSYDFKSATKLAKCDQNQIIEIIYKANEKNQLSIISRKNKHRSCKCITIA